jgi:hypothetical protein
VERFVGPYGRDVKDMIKPTNAQLIARVTLADEEDTQRVITPNNDSDLQLRRRLL